MQLCINYRTKEQQYQRKINQILESDLQARTSTFIKSIGNPEPCGRYQRYVSILARILFDGVDVF